MDVRKMILIMKIVNRLKIDLNSCRAERIIKNLFELEI